MYIKRQEVVAACHKILNLINFWFGTKSKISGFGAASAWGEIELKQLTFGAYTKTEISMFSACAWIQSITVVYICFILWFVFYPFILNLN